MHELSLKAEQKQLITDVFLEALLKKSHLCLKDKKSSSSLSYEAWTPERFDFFSLYMILSYSWASE